MMGGWMYLLLLLFVCFGHSHAFHVPVSHRRTYVSSALGSTVQDNNKMGSPSLTDKSFESNDPFEQSLMPLIKKMVLCETHKVSKASPYMLRVLQTQYPLRTKWANDMMRAWREHKNPLETAQNTQEILDTVILEDVLEPDTYSYGLVVSSWIYHAINKGNIDSMECAMLQLGRMQARWQQDKKRARPDLLLYQQLFMGWLKFGTKMPEHASRAYSNMLTLLREMRTNNVRPTQEFQKRFFFHVRDINKNNNNCQSHLILLEDIMRELEKDNGDTATFSTSMRKVLTTMYLETTSLDDRMVASRLSVLLQEWYDMGSDRKSLPAKKLLTQIMASKTSFASKRALVDAMWQVYKQTKDDTMKPDQMTYSVLLQTVKKSQDAQNTLQEMWDGYHSGDAQLKPNVYNYVDMLRVTSSGTEGEKLLKQLWKLYNEDPETNKDLKPNAFVYASVIRIWSKSKNHIAGAKAAKLLREMWDMDARGHKDMRPRRLQYNQVIRTISRCGGVKVEADTQEIFQDLVTRYEQIADPHIKPTQFIYTARLQVLLDNRRIENASKKAVALLREMTASNDMDMKPQENNYDQVLQVLSTDNAREAGELAEEILQELWDLYEKDPSPHPVSKRTFKPTNFKYSCVVEAWASSEHENAGERAEALLRSMWSRYKAGDEDLKPNKIHYTNAIKANKQHRAMALLEEMWKLYEETGDDSFRPNKKTYATVLRVLAKGSSADAGDRAIALFRDMEARYKSGIAALKPNLIGYGEVLRVLNANPTEKSGLQAEALLREMWDIYNEEGNESMKPSAITYSGVIQALCRSKDEHAYENGRRVLREMWDRYNQGDENLKPINLLYTQMIVAMSNGSEKGFAHAKELLAEMFDLFHKTGDKSIKPDNWTYTAMLTMVSGMRNKDDDFVRKTMGEIWHGTKKDDALVQETLKELSAPSNNDDDIVMTMEDGDDDDDEPEHPLEAMWNNLKKSLANTWKF